MEVAATHTTDQIARGSVILTGASAFQARRPPLSRAGTKIKTFAEGDTLLGYGERRREVFILNSGEVKALGPSLCKNRAVLLTTLDAKGTWLNSNGMFGGWSGQCADFQAANAVKCRVVTFDAWSGALGEETFRQCRYGMVRAKHTRLRRGMCMSEH